MIPGTVLLILSFVLGHDGTCGSTFDSSETCRQPNVGLLILGVLAFGVAYIAYYAILCRSLGRTGQTWGRKAMGYKVVDADTGQPIGALKALGRYLVSAILDGICYIGYLWPLLDPRKQKWSDKAMNTIAVKV